MENCLIESLIELDRKEDEIYIQKKAFSAVDGFIACIGKHGQGKSSLCSAYYKTLYGLDKEIFSISNARLTFTKGLWIIKARERRKIKNNIVKDITWKYIMIVAFLCTDIIVVNIDSRFYKVKKIMGIIWNSLENMKQLQLPKILKTI